ncbi:MAG: exonuclease [Pseudomonadota bacterium]
MSDLQEVTLLIDGDVIAYRAASAVQKNEEDGFGFVRPFANIAEGEAAVMNAILGLQADLGASHAVVVLSDPSGNWRSELVDSYKGNRDPAARPLLLGRLKAFLKDELGAFWWPGLEADDTLGILATSPETYAGKRIVVGKDKDFKTIPGFHHTVGDRDGSGRPKVREISLWEADRFHLIQTLAGDRIDGYDGCPGIGMERAERIIDAPTRLRPEPGVITRGPRKGEKTIKWVAEETQDLWACIVTHYQKAGLTEAEALTTARLANILRADQYDRASETITLWTPDRLTPKPSAD